MGENQCLCHKRHWVMFSTFANRNCHRHHSNGSKAAVLWAFPFPFQRVSFFPIYLLNGNVASIHPSNWRATYEKLMKRTNIYIYTFICFYVRVKYSKNLGSHFVNVFHFDLSSFVFFIYFGEFVQLLEIVDICDLLLFCIGWFYKQYFKGKLVLKFQ